MKVIDKNSLNSLLVCVALCSIAGLFSPLHWFFDLFNHFRPQAVLGAVILLLPMLYLKNRRMALLAIAVILLNASLIGVRIHAFGNNKEQNSVAQATDAVSVISANVLQVNTNYDAVINLVQREQPDIFVALEVNRAWVKNLEKIEGLYPHHMKVPYDDNFGMAIYARAPFRGEFEDVGNTYALPLFVGEFDGFTLLALHPIPPGDAKRSADNRLYIAKGAEIAKASDKPVIMAGDFNATFWADNIKPLLSAGLSPANPFGMTWTWPAWFFPLAIQIDHIFTHNAETLAFEALEDIGSDHYPLKATIAYAKAGGEHK